MNSLEILGKAAVNSKFRESLFTDVDSVIAANKADLRSAEEEALRRVVEKTCPMREGMRGEPEANKLSDALDAVGKAIQRMCPQEPCEWP